MDAQASMGQGRRNPPAEVWEAVRTDYLAGLSAPECCRRHGVGLTALRSRAARDGWRRTDQPWMPPNRLDPYDEGQELEEAIGGDLNRLEFGDLPHVARSRMERAVLRGDPLAALRWRRVETMLQEGDDELKRWVEEERFRVARLARAEERAAEMEALAAEADAADDPAVSADGAASADGAVASDGVFYEG